MSNQGRIALSYSRLSDYRQCPFKFRLKYLDKLFKFDDTSPHLIHGSNVHKGLENYVIKRIAGQSSSPTIAMLPEVRDTVPLIDRLFETFNEVRPELQIAVDDQYRQVDWFSKDAYWRAIVDLTCIGEKMAFIIDWKTGKVYDYTDKMGQLHLTALIMMMTLPKIDLVKVAYMYVTSKQSQAIELNRSDVMHLKQSFDAEHAKVNADREFKATPNEFCKWCEATKTQCPYSRKF